MNKDEVAVILQKAEALDALLSDMLSESVSLMHKGMPHASPAHIELAKLLLENDSDKLESRLCSMDEESLKCVLLELRKHLEEIRNETFTWSNLWAISPAYTALVREVDCRIGSSLSA